MVAAEKEKPTEQEIIKKEESLEANVAGRKAALSVLSSTDETLKQNTHINFRWRFWEIIRDEAIRQVGLPPNYPEKLNPFTDKEAKEQLAGLMHFGQYEGSVVQEVFEKDIEYVRDMVHRPLMLQTVLKKLLVWWDAKEEKKQKEAMALKMKESKEQGRRDLGLDKPQTPVDDKSKDS